MLPNSLALTVSAEPDAGIIIDPLIAFTSNLYRERSKSDDFFESKKSNWKPVFLNEIGEVIN
jgi:hypothetical protein